MPGGSGPVNCGQVDGCEMGGVLWRSGLSWVVEGASDVRSISVEGYLGEACIGSAWKKDCMNVCIFYTPVIFNVVSCFLVKFGRLCQWAVTSLCGT